MVPARSQGRCMVPQLPIAAMMAITYIEDLVYENAYPMGTGQELHHNAGDVS